MSADAIGDALAQLRAHGLLVDALEVDGRIHRVDVDGGRRNKKPGWYLCNWFRLDNGQQVVVGAYGVWVGDDPGAQKLEFASDGGISEAERERLHQAQQAMAAAQAQDLAQRRADAATRAEKLWQGLHEGGRSPYLERKGVQPYGCRFGRDGALVVPMRRPFESALVGLQFIDASGAKRFLSGTAKQGAAHLIGFIGEDTPILIGEGYATCASAYLAACAPVLVTFDCGNLLIVAHAVREQLPNRSIVVVADNDQWTMRGDVRREQFPADFDFAAIPGDDPRWAEWRAKGWLVNAGLDAAFEVARELGAHVAVPPIPADDPAKRTDFNDLHTSAGLDAVRAAFAADALREAPEHEAPLEASAPQAEPVAPPAAPMTIEEMLARFELIYGTADAWDIETGTRIARSALSALVGPKLARAWRESTAKRVRLMPPEPPRAKPQDAEEQSSGRSARGDPGGRDGLPPDDWRWQLRYKSGVLVPQIWNIQLILRNDPAWLGVFGFDAFAKRIVKCKPAPYGGEPGLLTDTDETQAGAWFGRRDTYRTAIKTLQVREAIAVAAMDRMFHPVRDYLTALVWDGRARIDTFFSDCCGAAEHAMHAKFASNFFIQAVARIFRPGCKADLMLVLEGQQGARKSSLVETLAGGFYADIGTGPSDKDFFQIIQGCWLVEISELASFAKAESSHIKRAISVAIDRFRKSYGHNVEEFKRECVFVGTVNNSDWQRDETGGRRFMPILIREVDLHAVRAIRDQLWAEAVHRFNAGETWHELPPEAREAQDDRYVEDVWTSRIVRWLEGLLAAEMYVPEHHGPIRRTTVSEILSKVIDVPLSKQGRTEQMRVGTILTRLGWTRKDRRVGQLKVREYHRPAPEPAPDEDEQA